MAKRPKGFGQPSRKPHKKTSKQVSPKPIALHLNPLPDLEFLEQKEERLRQIFAIANDIPQVTPDSLRRYAQYLQTRLWSGVTLYADEPLSWEVVYIYGSGAPQVHERLRKQRPSYLDHYQFLTLHEAIDPNHGLHVNLQRIGDSKFFTLPLNILKVLPFDSPAMFDNSREPLGAPAMDIADYRFWWEHYRPMFP